MKAKIYTIRVLGASAESDSWVTVAMLDGVEVSRRDATGNEIRWARQMVDL